MNFNVTPRKQSNSFCLATPPTTTTTKKKQSNKRKATNNIHHDSYFGSPRKKQKVGIFEVASPSKLKSITHGLNNIFVSPTMSNPKKSSFVLASSNATNIISEHKEYFIIPSNEIATKESLLYNNNRFIMDGKPHDWNSQENKVTSRYWRCKRYWNDKCQGRIVTYQYHHMNYTPKNKFGKIYKFTPHTTNHDDTWTAKHAEKSICMHMIKNSSFNTNATTRANFKQFQRYYPQQSMDHFSRYNKLKSYLLRHTTKPCTPASRDQYINQLASTELGYNFWKHQLYSTEFKDKQWEEVEAEFNQANPRLNINLHPEISFTPASLKVIELQRQIAKIQLETNYYHSKIISDELPENFMSNLYLASTEDGDVILQSKHGGHRINHKRVKLVNVDCTFTCPRGLEGTMFSQLCFINAQLDAPDSAHTHNQYPSAMMLLTSKKKETYEKVFKLFLEQNKTLYNYEFDNVTQLSSDMEWNLFTELKNAIFILAQFLFCLFHYMQANFKKMRRLGLYSLLKTDKDFYEKTMLYLYATFVHPTWVVKYQESMAEQLLAATPHGKKLTVKAFLKYNRRTYQKLFPVEWWNCALRDGLKFTNNFSENFNKHWKSAVGPRPNILNVTTQWREIDANATVDFETHIKDPTNPDNFNSKPKLKQRRDEAITKTMKEYNEYCAAHISNNSDTTTLEEHQAHVTRMFRLMKSYDEEITEVLTNSAQADDEEEQSLIYKEEDSNNEQDAEMTEAFSKTYTFRKYPSTKLFQQTNILDDEQCALLNKEIKNSKFWQNTMNALKFFDTDKNVIKNTGQYMDYTDRFDDTLKRTCIAFMVKRKWHPGVIVDIEANYFEILA